MPEVDPEPTDPENPEDVTDPPADDSGEGNDDVTDAPAADETTN